MKAHGPFTYSEPCGDLFVCIACRNEREDLALALSQSSSPYVHASRAIAASQQPPVQSSTDRLPLTTVQLSASGA
jgi:hypothetical protein